MKIQVELSSGAHESLVEASQISGRTVEEVASLLLDYAAPLAAHLAALGRDRKEARKNEPRPEFLAMDADGVSLKEQS